MISTHRQGASTAFAVGTLLLLPVPSLTASPAEGVTRPEAVSPGELDHVVEMGAGCFTFSWSTVEGARGFELAAFRVDGAKTEVETTGEPALRVFVPATSAWTPSLEKCLRPGRYGWVVRARTAAGWTDWSEPRLFEVRGGGQGGPPSAARPPLPPAPALTLDGDSPAIVGSPPAAGADLVTAAVPSAQALTGEVFSPPACTSHFADVGPSNAFCPWIEQFWRDEITGDEGCGGGNYCPKAPVTREQLALFLERVMRGTDTWRPEQGDGAATITPAPTGVHRLFTDANGHTSITIGADGLGLISYYAQTDGALKVAHCADVNCATADTFSTVDAESVYAYTSITIGADGFGLISYYDALSHDLKVAHCSNVECTTVDAITPLDTTDDMGQFSSVTIGRDGLGLISYYDAFHGWLKVAHCSNINCTAGTPTPLDDGGAYTSITFGADGLGLISYYTGDLKVAHCSNVNCTAATITPLDTADDAGLYTSITIGTDGLGLISYYDNTNHDLKVAHCSNPNCSAATITALDTAGDVGQYSSITIGADGLGLIGYYDATNGDLKVAHCSNVLCAPYFRRR